MSEQRTIQRLQAEVRALEHELTAARYWLSYQADHITRLEKRLGEGWLLSLTRRTNTFEAQAELARGEDS